MRAIRFVPLLAGLALGAAWAFDGPDAAPAVPAVEASARPDAEGPTIDVYKSPTCGCCVKWEEHLRAGGFAVTAHPTSDMAAKKAELGVPEEVASCHTAVVDGYVVEGHVPADAVRRLLEERPDARGLAVPGMPIGSPGMESPRHDPEPFDVLLVRPDGSTEVFEHVS